MKLFLRVSFGLEKIIFTHKRTRKEREKNEKRTREKVRKKQECPLFMLINSQTKREK